MRPLALYAAVGLLPTMLLYLASIRPAPGAPPGGLSPPLFVWVVSYSLPAIASWCAALFVLARDREMEPAVRDRWTYFVFFTMIVGGPLFLVLRWWRERSGNSPGDAAADATPRPLAADAVRGIRWGLLVAAILCLWAAALRLDALTVSFETEPVSYAALLALYVAGGVMGGAAVGMLSRVLRSGVEAALVGYFAAVLVALGGRIGQVGFIPFTLHDIVVPLVMWWGAPLGYMLWKEFRSPPPASSAVLRDLRASA